ARLVLGLVDASHIIEGHSGIGFDVNLGFALADGHETAAQTLAHAPRQKRPQAEEDDRGNDPREQVRQQRALHLARIGDSELLQVTGELRVDSRRHELLLSVWQRLFQGPLDVAIGYSDPIDLAVLEQLLKLAVGKRFDPLADRVEVLEEQNTDDGGQPIADVKLRLLVHARPPDSRSMQPVSYI